MLQEFFLTLVGLVTYQCIGVGLFLPFEIIFPNARLSITKRASGFIFLLATAPVTAMVGALVVSLQSALGIHGIPIHFGIGTPVVASIVAALWMDSAFYTIHRIERRFFWRFHAVHHSFHHWSEAIVGLTIAIPLMFFDVQIGPTLGLLTLFFTYQQFYIHSSSRPHFGPLRLLLVDNRYHRIHHSTDPAHHDKNFGAMSPLWDWLFGTLRMPAKDEWPEVGLKEVGEPQSLKEWSSLPWRFCSSSVTVKEDRQIAEA